MRKKGAALAAVTRAALAALLLSVSFPVHLAPDAPNDVRLGAARAVGGELADAGPADPYAGLAQWGWHTAQVDAAWDRQLGSPDVIVATIDTGVDRGHPDLAGVLLPGATFVSAPSSVCPDGDGQDDNSHGTHIAGIIGANRNNSLGIGGVAYGVRILPVKALDCAGFGMTSDIAKGIVWATDQGARIVNVSLGTSVDAADLDAAVRYALGRGALVIAAAGNCGALGGRCQVADRPEYPAALPGVLAVGATDTGDGLAMFSTRGPQIALAAPGVRIVSTMPRYPTYGSSRGESLGYGTMSGTSQSSAFVSGIAALIWSAAPSLSARDVFELLTSSAEDFGAPGRDDGFGSGRVNALRAVQGAQIAAMKSRSLVAVQPH